MTVGIVGLGLIGGSFAKALHRGKDEVFAWNRNLETLKFALADSIDEELTKDNIGKCDLIILTTYPEHCVSWLEEFATYISSDTIVIDAAGTKRKICAACWEIAENNNFTFVGCHPMAGTQFSGYKNAKADMFEGAPMIVVPNPELSDIERVKIIDRIQTFLSPCKFGFYTQSTAENHDRIIAYTSQLAHVVSSAYANNPVALDRRGFSAGSWKDLTRVAWLNPDMWAELFLENGDYLSEDIDKTIKNLMRFKLAIDNNDKVELVKILAEGDEIKRKSEKLGE
jgi:prephenate dehydrogenase